ncbi:hypothetical protein [Micromonospora sp. NPDC049891]|uniref:hypothetical protein n=1 Tax=Micromonospora sp. NPDC049891 TaxID=3155655 RepID=UPI0033E1190C
MTEVGPAAGGDSRDLTDELRRSRAAGRDPGADLVPDASGGDPIPWEEPRLAEPPPPDDAGDDGEG